MYTKQPKKMIIMNILEILRTYSDENHTLSLTDIVKRLETEYDMNTDRKAVKRNIDILLDAGFNIEFSETPRKTKKSGSGVLEDSTIHSDYYYLHDFTESELRLLVDSLLFSTHLPYNQCKALVEKLEKLSSKYFKSRVKHIHAMPNLRPHNDQIFYNVDLLDEAISAKKQVAFNYCEYGTDMKMHKRKNKKGEEKKFIINPYQMAAKDGNYYLICNREGYKNLSNYRIDRITDMSVLDTKVTPFEKLEVTGKTKLSLSEYMKSHIYMYTGKQTKATFEIDKRRISDVIDRFGMEVRFSDETDDTVCANVKADNLSILQFAKNYSPYVKITSPPELVEMIRKEIEEMRKLYK